jgi:hypothetical protein
VLFQTDSEVSSAYGVRATPAAILVAPDGTVASAPVAGPHGIEELIRIGLGPQPGALQVVPG